MSENEFNLTQIQRYNESKGDLNEYDGYDCKECKNKGFIANINDKGSIIYSFCRCNAIRDVISNAKKSGLGDAITKCKFDNFEISENWQKEIKEQAVKFCSDNNSNWFYIGGQSGSGKTHLCTAITMRYIQSGYDTVYMPWCEASKKIKSLVTDSGYSNEVQKYKDADVLYIDDFLKTRGRENPTAADMNLAFEIINARTFDSSKVTIISSEKTLDDLMDYDEATMSRIFEYAGEYKINISADRTKNYRLRMK